jgi:hypothetical protein
MDRELLHTQLWLIICSEATAPNLMGECDERGPGINGQLPSSLSLWHSLHFYSVAAMKPKHGFSLQRASRCVSR